MTSLTFLRKGTGSGVLALSTGTSQVFKVYRVTQLLERHAVFDRSGTGGLSSQDCVQANSVAQCQVLQRIDIGLIADELGVLNDIGDRLAGDLQRASQVGIIGAACASTDLLAR